MIPQTAIRPLNEKSLTAPTPAQLCDFLGNRLVYAVISQRAGGLLFGIDMNPDQHCNFDCVYCYVNRGEPHTRKPFSVKVLSSELRALLESHRAGRFHELAAFSQVPEDLLKLKGVAFSGEGEPTLCGRFADVVQEVSAIRGNSRSNDFKLILITNGTGLNLPAVQIGLRHFRVTDEVWVKLDAGTDEYMRRVNKSPLPLKSIVENILALGRWRPVNIQSLFCAIDGVGPDDEEIEAYIQRLNGITEGGAIIPLVQIYSLVRGSADPRCARLALNRLSSIARRVRDATGLCVEVY